MKNKHLNQQARGQILVWVILGLIILGSAGAVAAWRMGYFNQEVKSEANLYTVSKGPLSIEVNEVGAIDAKQNIVVRSRVPGRVMVTWLIEEGSTVSKGDKLVELDNSNFQNQLVDQGNKRDSAKANLINAEEELKITRSKAASDIEQAELDLKLAKLDLEKYEKGEYPRDLQKADSDITIAQEELTRAIDQEEWSTKLAKKGYVSDSDLKADQLNRKRKEIALELAQTEKDLLVNYSRERRLAELKNRVSQNTQSLDRVKARTTADIKKSEANLINRKADYDRQVLKFGDIEKLIQLTTITAPVDGIAIYSTSGGNSRWSQKDPLEAGQEVRQRQELIQIPINNEMMAVAKIPEAMLPKISVGLPVSMTVDAVPGKTFTGQVGRIARQPDPSGWWNNNLKVYSVDIHLDGATDMLRTGMNCQVTIQTAYFEEAISVPMQSVVGVGDQTVVYKIDGAGNEIPVQVKVGLDDNRKVHILEGLEVGDQIMLNPPLGDAEIAPARKLEGAEAIQRPEGSTTLQGATTQPSIDPQIMERLQRLKGARDQGWLGRIPLPDAEKKTLNKWLDDLEADKLTEIDEKEFNRIRGLINAQMQKMRQRRSQQNQGGS